MKLISTGTRRKNGEMVRIRVKSYDNGINFCLKLIMLETVSKNNHQGERWLSLGQLVLPIDEVLALTGLTGSLHANDLSIEDGGRRPEFDQVVPKLIEGKFPSNSLLISVEDASRGDVGNELEVVLQGAFRERDCHFQPKAGQKRKKVELPKKF